MASWGCVGWWNGAPARLCLDHSQVHLKASTAAPGCTPAQCPCPALPLASHVSVESALKLASPLHRPPTIAGRHHAPVRRAGVQRLLVLARAPRAAGGRRFDVFMARLPCLEPHAMMVFIQFIETEAVTWSRAWRCCLSCAASPLCARSCLFAGAGGHAAAACRGPFHFNGICHVLTRLSLVYCDGRRSWWTRHSSLWREPCA